MARNFVIFTAAIACCVMVTTCLEEFPVINTPATYQVLKKPGANVFQEILVTPNNVPSKKTAPTCGEVLTASNGGGIFYKTFEQVDDYERCVWIIAAPNATGYTVNVMHLGSPTNHPGSRQELIITAIRWDFHSYGGARFSSYKPTSTGSITLDDASLLLVTFLSERTVGTSYGFAIQYQEDRTGGLKTSTKSTHHLFDSRVLKFKYPVTDSVYDRMELAAFVFLPQNNVYTGNGNLLWYELGELESQYPCADAVDLYILNNHVPDGDEKWQHSKKLCGNVTTYEMTHDDITLALFLSDGGGESSGFSFYYSGCPL